MTIPMDTVHLLMFPWILLTLIQKMSYFTRILCLYVCFIQLYANETSIKLCLSVCPSLSAWLSPTGKDVRRTLGNSTTKDPVHRNK